VRPPRRSSLAYMIDPGLALAALVVDREQPVPVVPATVRVRAAVPVPDASVRRVEPEMIPPLRVLAWPPPDPAGWTIP
jgi:hypothetical protein